MKPLSREFLLQRGWCCHLDCINCPYENEMLVIDLDGKQIKWQIKGHEVTGDKRPRSDLHLQARKLLKEKFPTQQILEEVSVPVKRGKTLYLDFYLPLRQIAIEVHGEQHYKRIAHFHDSPMAFANQLSNDREKREWCEINGITHIVLPFDKTTEWELMI